ncbi:MAG: hypothetical protein ABR958_05095 [Dehalococcoidales bacterium]
MVEEATKRTEDDKIAQAPLELILGGQKYLVKLLVIKESRAWRQKLIKILAKIPKAITNNPDEFRETLNATLVVMPDQIVDLVFDYARELNREEILAQASDMEMATAFWQIVEVAFPLVTSLAKSMKRIAPRPEQ